MSNVINYDAGKIVGGHIAEVAEPHVRKWPNCPYPRGVTATITRYYNVGEHYFVSIQEEENPLWDTEERTWRICWDDTEDEGLNDTKLYLRGDISRPGPFGSYGEAKAFVEKVIRGYFPDHELTMNDYCKEWEEVRKEFE